MSFSAGDVPPATEQVSGDDRLDFLLEWTEAPESQDDPATAPSGEVAWLGSSALADGPGATDMPEAPRPQSEEPGGGTGAPEPAAGAEPSSPENRLEIVPPPAHDDVAPGALEDQAEETDDSPEFFEWTAQRHQAIEAALGTCPAGSLPRVHHQLEVIRQALEGGHVAPDRILALLDEVEQYLAQRTAALASRVPVAHAAIIESRTDRERALDAYGQSVTALREYLATGDRVHLDVAVYTAEQGSSCLASARRVVMEAEPEPPAGGAEE